MSRQPIYDSQKLGEIPGLVSLTEPAEDERIIAIVDVPILGAPRAGKTQFVVTAVRTLRAHAPDLDGAEIHHNRDLLRTVMNAREPSPGATSIDSVPHYVFRVGASSLWSELGLSTRALLALRAGLLRDLALAAVVGAVAFAVLLFWRTSVDGAVVAGAIAALAASAAIGWRAARGRFRAGGEIEVVFWDVAGAHVYSETSADYYGFLERLVRERRRRARPWRGHVFAPVLVCDPISLGLDPHESSFARLRKLLPIFSALNEPSPRALIAINRYSSVARVCEPDRDRDDVVTLRVSRRDDGEQRAEPSEQRVRREVLRKLCVDSEDGWAEGVHVRHLRFDAADLVDVRLAGDTIECEYRDGTGGFEGDARRTFFSWLAEVAVFASHRPRFAPLPAPNAAGVVSGNVSGVESRVVMDVAVERMNPELRWQPAGDHARRTLQGMSSAIEEHRGRTRADASSSNVMSADRSNSLPTWSGVRDGFPGGVEP
jgi:hypothetical protein